MIWKKIATRATSKLLLLSLGVGALLVAAPRLASSQPAGVNRQAIQSLNLSRSQMQQLRGAVQSYQAELEDILTSEQLEQLKDLQAAMRDGDSASVPSDPFAELDLSADQESQLATLQEGMTEDLRAILSEQQFEEIQEIGLPGL